MKIWLSVTLAGLLILSMNILVDWSNLKVPPTPPPSIIQKATLGFSQAMASSLWVRYLQDVDYCRPNAVNLQDSLSDSGARFGPNRTHSCDKGWAYQMLKLAINIDPRFHLAASKGPIGLSVLADDIHGATEIFEYSTKLYPNDWSIHYHAGYHYMLELEDYKKAAKYYQRAYELGGPTWLPRLVARLQTKAGQYWLAKSTLESYLRSVGENEELKENIKSKLKELEKMKARQ